MVRGKTATSPFIGVSARHQTPGKWQARIRRLGVSKHLGYFDSQKEARAAYVLEAKRLRDMGKQAIEAGRLKE